MIRAMTPPLPLPVRVAVGLAAVAVEQARELPRLALELPVTAVSQALQASMRVQQKITELALKGDRVLGGPPVEEAPAWATFDDDLPAGRNGGALTEPPDLAEPATVTPLRPPPTEPGDDDGPAVLPGYRDMTIPQLRGRLRHLGVDDLRALLAWEQAHGDRPPYVTMLSNRITTVAEG
jgi:hypothetical protein